MNHPLKWLVLAALTNLIGNVLGTTLALQHNLIADLGGSLHGQDVFHDFISTGTALSAPLTYMLIQLALKCDSGSSPWLISILVTKSSELLTMGTE